MVECEGNTLVNDYVREWNAKWFVNIGGDVSNVCTTCGGSLNVYGLERVEVPAWPIT